MENNRKGISPVISIVIIVSVSIAVAISIALWMSGIIGGFTKYEKLELKAAYAEYVETSVQQGWSYRIPITITEQSGNDLTDYSVLVVIDTASLINAGKMKSDGGDIRFYASDGTTSLPYWIESGLGTSTTRIWVKVPSIPANSQTTIYMYYGNPQATSQSNPQATFLWFDDFSSDTSSNYDIGRHAVNWHGFGVYFPYYDPNNERVAYDTGDNYAGGWMPKTLNIENFCVKVTMGVTGSYPYNTTNGILGRWKDSNTFYGIHIAGGSYRPEPAICLNSRAITLVGASPSVYHPMDGTPFTLQLMIYGNKIKGIYNEGKPDEVILETIDNSITGAGKIVIIVSQSIGWFDDLIIRNYVDPEPSVTIGTEETSSEFAFNGWIVYVTITNTGEIDSTISSIFINGRSIDSYSQVFKVVNKDSGEVYYNSTTNKFEDGIPVKNGETITLKIYIAMGKLFRHGSNIEVKIKTASGQEYSKAIQLP